MIHSVLEARVKPLVLAHACVDGGATDCSLALVSHQMRDVSSRTRLQSVTVCGLARIKSLLRLLEDVPEDGRHIRFLLIGIERPKAMERVAANFAARLPLVDLQRKRQRQRSSLAYALSYAFADLHMTDDSDEVQIVYERILSLVAPYLEVLTNHLEYGVLPGLLLPRLHSLTMTGYNLWETTPPPHLRHLHIIGQSYALGLPFWLAGAQELECLHLSGVWCEGGLPRLLRVLMGVEGQRYSDINLDLAMMAWTARAPCPDIQALRYLKRVTVDTVIQERRPSGKCATCFLWHDSMMESLARLELDSACGPVEFVLLRGGRDSHEQAMLDWRGMIEVITSGDSG
jgi:hypothetical protein